MQRSDEQPKKRASGTRKSEPTALSYSEGPERETRNTQEDLLYDDDVATDSLRSNTTAIRRTNLIPASRTTGSQTSPVPQRRTGSQAQQPTTSLPTPIFTQQYPRN